MEEFKYSCFCKFSTEDLWEALLLQIQTINFPPHFRQELKWKGIREQVTCCPCVVWNSWATAAKASELGSCGTLGTEFAVTCGGSEGTLAGGGGEPEGVQEHRKGSVTPQRSPCTPQQVSAAYRAYSHHPSCTFCPFCHELLRSLLTPVLGMH